MKGETIVSRVQDVCRLRGCLGMRGTVTRSGAIR
jgi:hypothetical protein